MKIKYRVTYTNKEGVRYTDEFEGKDDAHSVGCWDAPFPNTKEESTAFGLWECLSQSDNCPPKFLESPPIKIRVEKISCIDIEWHDGEMISCRLLKQVKCRKCGSHELDIFVVDQSCEETQAYRCRLCGATGFFGVSE